MFGVPTVAVIGYGCALFVWSAVWFPNGLSV